MNKSGGDLIKTRDSFFLFFVSFVLFYFLSPWISLALSFSFGRGPFDNFLFFWSGMAIPLGLLPKQTDTFQICFQSSAWKFAIIFWAMVGLVFSWTLRNKGFGIKLMVVYPVIIVTTLLMVFVMGLAGYVPHLDGP